MGETLDQVAMIRKLKKNATINNFWYSDIERSMQHSDWFVIVLSNQSLLVRTLSQHAILVTLCHKPAICLWALIGQEAIYSLFNIYCNKKYSHLKHSAMLAPKIFQSIFLIFILVQLLLAHRTNKGLKQSFSESE